MRTRLFSWLALALILMVALSSCEEQEATVSQETATPQTPVDDAIQVPHINDWVYSCHYHITFLALPAQSPP